MIARRIICDECNLEVSSTVYRVKYDEVNKIIIIELTSTNAITKNDSSSHYCSRQCLMLGLDEMFELFRRKKYGNIGRD